MLKDALATELARLNTTQRKHAYTIAEVCEQIGYSRNTVSLFIREGKADRSGRIIKLKAREITNGDYRVTPQDLDDFLAHF